MGQPNGHHIEPQTRAETDAKANTASPIVAPEADAPPPTAETTEGSAAAATPGAEAGVAVDITKEAVAEPSVDKSDGTPQRRALSGDDGSPPHGDATVEKPTPAARPPTRPLPPPRHPRPVPSTVRRALSENLEKRVENKLELEEQQPESAPDGTPYVGDGTWEERTWKELTRLREDMFWARMGGVQ